MRGKKWLEAMLKILPLLTPHPGRLFIRFLLLEKGG
jgi:hypothetical protein